MLPLYLQWNPNTKNIISCETLETSVGSSSWIASTPWSQDFNFERNWEEISSAISDISRWMVSFDTDIASSLFAIMLSKNSFNPKQGLKLYAHGMHLVRCVCLLSTSIGVREGIFLGCKNFCPNLVLFFPNNLQTTSLNVKAKIYYCKQIKVSACLIRPPNFRGSKPYNLN